MAVRKAVEAGATEAEAYVEQRRGYVGYAVGNQIVDTRSVSEAGVGVRVAVGRRVGFSYASSLDPGEIAEAARRAVKAARVSQEDPDWSGLPEPSPVYPEPEAIYDSSLARVRPEKVVELLSEMIEEASSHEGVIVNRAEARVLTIRRAVASTSGVYRIDTGTLALLWLLVLARRDNVVTPLHMAFAYGRVQIPSPRLLARRAAEEITRSFKVEKLTEPRRMTVVLTAKAVAELAEIIGSWFKGNNYVRGVTPFAGKLGEQVLSEKITIVDDGTLRQGFNTWRFDWEGVPMQRKVVVEKGVFKTPVYDHYWARRAGAESTGNAFREGYTSPPTVGYTNVVIEKGDASLDELLEGEVLLVEGVQGAHTASPYTGEYSVIASPAWIVRNGEEYRLVRGAMIAGNLVEQLRDRLEAVGSWQEDLPGIRTPWLRITDVTVTPQA